MLGAPLDSPRPPGGSRRSRFAGERIAKLGAYPSLADATAAAGTAVADMAISDPSDVGGRQEIGAEQAPAEPASSGVRRQACVVRPDRRSAGARHQRLTQVFFSARRSRGELLRARRRPNVAWEKRKKRPVIVAAARRLSSPDAGPRSHASCRPPGDSRSLALQSQTARSQRAVAWPRHGRATALRSLARGPRLHRRSGQRRSQVGKCTSASAPACAIPI